MANNVAGISSSTRTLRSLPLKEAIVVSPLITILDATKQMTLKNIDSVIVVGMTGDSSVPFAMRKSLIHGIVTVKDVANRVIAKGLDPSKVLVSQIMTTPLQTVTLDTTLYTVVMMMNQNNFRQVPVVESDKVVGLVTSSMLNTSIMNDIVEDIKLLATIFR